MLRLFRAELFKMARSKVLLVSLVVPLFLFGLFVLGFGGVDEQLIWEVPIRGASYAWAYFLLPMTATVITAMLGQIEHKPNTWSYALSLPQPKWQVFIVKAMAALLVMAWISILILVATIGAGLVHNALRPENAFIGYMSWKFMARDLAEIWVAGFMLIAIQFGVAMRFGGLVLPLFIGIGGVFLAILVGVLEQLSFLGIATDEYNFMPWLLPANMLSAEAGLGTQTLIVGGAGGVVLFGLIAVWLARKDWT